MMWTVQESQGLAMDLWVVEDLEISFSRSLPLKHLTYSM